MSTYRPSKSRKSIFAALLRARRQFGGKTVAIVDADDRTFTYTEIIRAAFALGSVLRRYTKAGEKVGILLPTGAGSIIAFFALLAYGRIPAMLNFTSGPRNLKAAFGVAEIATIITAHRFISLAKLEKLEETLKKDVKILYLEDVREEIGLIDKIAGAAGPILPFLFRARPSPDAPGVILFTSGTEGDPKGVVLSHSNVVANVEQIRAHIDLRTTDVVFNPLPTFHCFGLTGGALLPLFSGMKAALYPSPLHVKIIPERVRTTGATVLFATDTFLSRYSRAGNQGDLDGLRFAVCGAERVRDETRAAVKKKFGLQVLEGYGVTEASPVIAVNTPEDNRPGTVGRLMPDMESRLDPVPGIEKGGRLFVRGPNIMQGYIKPEHPGKIVPLEDGWYDTGDIVEIDEDGYVAIRGRAKRFAKIAGEMVSLAVVENCATAIWPENQHVAITRPDPSRGEQIVLISDYADADRATLLTWAQSHGVPELAVPKKIVFVPTIPVLGSGKVDFVSAAKLLDKDTVA
ncbi:MAG: 2-acylglycerophosphoethanolamine acyltransferase [Robiginitomaculum sp.]|nr:MAG: 2-acylglycerophosphoethanolamine acyltransferase [Robiginitomaculum sp.]